MEHLPGIIVQTQIGGQAVRFFVTNVSDVIQNCHLNGSFYENEELAIIRKYFKSGSVFLDVGSNVGNHAIFVDKFLSPKRIILIEPTPPAIQILRINLLLNQISLADTRYLGLGLSDRTQTVRIEVPVNNLGGSRLHAQEGTGIQVVPADSLLSEEPHIDFAKIDVEGHELNVLRGMENIIARSRPLIFIEIENANVEAFLAWMNTHRYRSIERFRRYHSNENYMIGPE